MTNCQIFPPNTQERQQQESEFLPSAHGQEQAELAAQILVFPTVWGDQLSRQDPMGR